MGCASSSIAVAQEPTASAGQGGGVPGAAAAPAAKSSHVSPAMFASVVATRWQSAALEQSSKAWLMPAAPPLVLDVQCTLEELFHGCTKRLEIERQALSTPEKLQRHTVQAVIQAGWSAGTKLTFRGKAWAGDGGDGH